MAMVCAQCGQVFHGKVRQCPKCGILLLVQQHGVASPDDSIPLAGDPMSRWQQTPWGRIIVSVLIAQGLAFCLRQLFTAWFLASGAEGEPTDWNTPAGMVWLNAFHAISLILCGMLAGANQERGVTSGGLVGLWSGLIFLGLHRGSRDVLDPIVFFAQPFVHMLWGLLGGFIGNRIWKPVPLFHVEDDLGKSGYGMPRSSKRLLRGPIHILRVLLGASVALAGAVFAKEILDALMRYGQGALKIDSHLTERLIVYQMIALGTFVGGTIAGSSSRNGFKQGLCAGILAAALYMGVQLANPKSILEITLFTTAGVGVMCIAGGVFGSALFPPLAKEQPKNAIPY
jgi:hypothetical protein